MQVYLVRHGAYSMESSGSMGPPLSSVGKAQARSIGELLRAQGVKPDVVITSPYLRAQETAQGIQEALGSAIAPIVSRDFTPNGDPTTMRAVIEALPAKTVLVVGHMCSIGELAQHFTPSAPHNFETCTTVALERINDAWALQWVHHCERMF